MKVNISYAVELEDVPSEVGKLLDGCEDYLRRLHTDFDMLAASNPMKAVDDIANLRAGLKDIDLRLADCSNILSGYVDLQNRATTSESPLEIEEENGDTTL